MATTPDSVPSRRPPNAPVVPLEAAFESHPTMERLREAVGEEKTNGIIRSIGVAVLNAAPGGLPVSLETMVAATLGRLTQQDLAGLARGDTSVINRVQAMAEDQVKAVQATQPQTNPSGAAASGKSSNGQDSMSLRGFAGGVSAKDGGGQSNSREASSSSVAAAEISAVNAHNYAGTAFAKSGLSFDTFSALRAQGFGESNIIHAAQDTKANGFDVNNKKLASAFATLDKDDGKRRDERNMLLGRFRDKLDSDEEFQQLKAERDKAPTGELRADFERRMGKRGQEVSKEVGYRGFSDAAPTGKARDAGRHIENETIKLKGAIHDLSHGKKAEIDATSKIVADFRRNPEDAKARKDYSALPQHAAHSPREKIAIAKIDKSLVRAAELRADEEKRNLNKAAKIVAAKSALQDDSDWSSVAEATPAPAKVVSKDAEKSKAEPKNAEKASDKPKVRNAELKKPLPATLKS